MVTFRRPAPEGEFDVCPRAPWLPFTLGLAIAISANAAPALTYSTYLRDSFQPTAIATDAAGNIYLAGTAVVDPATSQNQVLVVKLNPQGSAYVYVRYVGGSVADSANAITVDAAGNVYVTGSTSSPDFPAVGGGNLGTPSGGRSFPRSFVFKLDPDGNMVFSDLLGGSAASTALAVAVNAEGQILVSGTCQSSGFPATAGAYSVPDSTERPYLLELDKGGAKLVFSATGIGGNAIALDSSGNIYVAGTTYLLDYPTTPGAYQPSFPAFNYCPSPVCMMEFQGANQYVTKVDPAGAKLIYSTAVSGSAGTTNTGLAVDAAGNAYVTGVAGATYPYTVASPSIPSTLPMNSGGTRAAPFLSKLDPAGTTLLFSVPVGGAGVAVDSLGTVYAGGVAGYFQNGSYTVTAGIPALANVPQPCLPNYVTISSSAYVAQVDSTKGTVLGTQFLGGSRLIPSAVALNGSVLWVAGSTNLEDVPFAGDALTLSPAASGVVPGAYLGAIDFSQPAPPAGTPQIACILDAADLAPAGPVATYQLLTIVGTGLGPAVGVSGGSNGATTLGGVTIALGSSPAMLLYASENQINFAAPAQIVPLPGPLADVRLSVNGVSAAPRAFAIGYRPSLFWNLPETFSSSGVLPGGVALALNADGSVNSPANPAQHGSLVSVFTNGIVPAPQDIGAPAQFYADGGWEVTNVAAVTPFVYRVDARLPMGGAGGLKNGGCTGLCPLTLYLSGGNAPGFGAYVWATQ